MVFLLSLFFFSPYFNILATLTKNLTSSSGKERHESKSKHSASKDSSPNSSSSNIVIKSKSSKSVKVRSDSIKEEKEDKHDKHDKSDKSDKQRHRDIQRTKSTSAKHDTEETK